MRGTGGRGNTAYATAKAGLHGLMIDIADTFGKQGIRINNVAPGSVATPMRNRDATSSGLTLEQINFPARIPVGFEGDGWDIARACLFLCGPDGRYVSGVLLPVDGGKTSTSH
jgi:NAD(P)-dependent dehydrogenase (short-subunit alcohol dehydrogenase family)